MTRVEEEEEEEDRWRDTVNRETCREEWDIVVEDGAERRYGSEWKTGHKNKRQN